MITMTKEEKTARLRRIELEKMINLPIDTSVLTVSDMVRWNRYVKALESITSGEMVDMSVPKMTII